MISQMDNDELKDYNNDLLKQRELLRKKMLKVMDKLGMLKRNKYINNITEKLNKYIKFYE